MSVIAESNVCPNRMAAIAAWLVARFARLRTNRRRRLIRIELESWSHHLRKDMGLAD